MSDLIGERVGVYWNSSKCVFSVIQKGKVIAHVCDLIMEGCYPVIWQSGQNKTRREKKKTVHAFVNGRVSQTEIHHEVRAAYLLCGNKIRYNPYKDDNFVFVGDEFPDKVFFTVVQGKPVMIQLGGV